MASITSLFIWVQVLKCSIQNNILISIELLLKSFICTNGGGETMTLLSAAKRSNTIFFVFSRLVPVASFVAISTRRLLFPLVQFITFSFRKLPLGIMTSAPSQVVI